jgi:hypothetical protein
MTTEFDTRDFQNSNGFNPEKSKGQGSWAFLPEGEDNWLFSPTSTFQDACEWAQNERPDANDFTLGA